MFVEHKNETRTHTIRRQRIQQSNEKEREKNLEGDDHMKEKLTITLEIDLLNQIDREMIRHQYNNKSKFVEYILRQVLYSPEQKFKLLEKSFQDAVRRQIAIANEKNALEEWIATKKAADEKFEEHIKDNDKDALWTTKE